MAREPIHFGTGSSSFTREPVHFDSGGSGFQRQPIHFGGGFGEEEENKLGWGDVPGQVWGGLKASAHAIPAVATQLVTTPDEFVADMRKSFIEIGKGFGNLPRAWGNLLVGDKEDFDKFGEAFRQKFFHDPLTYSVVGLYAGKGVGSRAAALRALKEGEYRTVTKGVDFDRPDINVGSVARAGILGWDPKLPDIAKRDVISVKLHAPIEGVGIAGEPIVTRTLPRSTLRAERMLLVDRALKRLPPHTWMLGEHSRAARAVRKTGRVPYLALMSLPVFAEADKAFRDMTKTEQTAYGIRNTLPTPDVLFQHVVNMKTLGTPEALQTVEVLINPKIRELYNRPTEKMLRYGELHKELEAERQKILIRSGAVETVKGPVPDFGTVPDFEASPFRHMQITRGAQYLTNSLANKYLRKTDATMRAAGVKGKRLVREAIRFGTTDLREITKQTRLASEDLMRESRRRAKVYERVQEGEAGLRDLEGQPEGSVATNIDHISALVDPAYDRMVNTGQMLDDVMGGSIDTNMLNNLDLVPPGSKLEGELGQALDPDNPDTLTGWPAGQQALAQAVWEALKKSETNEEKRLLALLKKARERKLTVAELAMVGETIPSDIRVPTAGELEEATKLRAKMEGIKQRLKEAKRFRLTEAETTRMAQTIDKMNRKILKLENPRAIVRSEKTLKRRFDSRYRRAEKKLLKQIGEQRASIKSLGEGIPVEKAPAEQLRMAAMKALERKMRRDTDQYETLWAGEMRLRDSAEKQSEILERIAGIKRDRQELHERKITYIAGQRERARDLIQHKQEILALRQEIDSSRGKLFGGGSPWELRHEIETWHERFGGAPRSVPVYRPDVMAAERKKFGRKSLAEGTITPQRPGADIYPSRSILFRTGQLAFHPDTLGPAYFFAAKHDLNVAMHKQALSMATKWAKGQALPKGYEYLRRTRGEKIGPIQQLGGEHMRAIAHEFDTEQDLTTRDHDDANLEEIFEKGQNYRYIVPTAFANEFRAEGKKANKFVENFIKRPMDVWRTLLLHLRVPWLINNILGNSFLYAIRFAGVGGLSAVLRFYAEDVKTAGYIPAMKRLASYKLSPEDQLQLHAEQIRGTRFESSATGELPESVRNLMPTRARQLMDENATARQAVKALQYVPTALPIVDKKFERYLRRKASTRVLRGSPEVQAAYATIRKQAGSATFREAVDKAYAGDEHLRDYVMTEVNQGLGDFLSLTRQERQYIRSLVPFYAWMREISRITTHMLVDHPMRAVVVQQMAEAASEIQAQEIPEYMRGAILLEKAGWLGALAAKLPGMGGEGGTQAFAMHGASPYSTVTDLLRGARALGPTGSKYDVREVLGNLNPIFGAGFDAAQQATAREGGTRYGLPADTALGFLRSIPQVQVLSPYPSNLMPDRNRADLLRKIFGDPRVVYDPDEADYQLFQGR